MLAAFTVFITIKQQKISVRLICPLNAMKSTKRRRIFAIPLQQPVFWCRKSTRRWIYIRWGLPLNGGNVM